MGAINGSLDAKVLPSMRIARIIVNVGKLCENNNLSEEDLPASLRAILSSLQRELDRIERVLKKCSRRKGIKGILLRKNLLTKIKQCDVELSTVLQAFQAELSLETRVALIVMRREAPSDSGLIEAIPTVDEPNHARIFNFLGNPHVSPSLPKIRRSFFFYSQPFLFIPSSG